MAVAIESKNPGATAAQVKTLSVVVGRLPDSYVEFLKRHNGLVPARNRFVVRQGRTGSVREIFAAEEALDVARQMQAELGHGVVPIGEAEGGNLICLVLHDGAVVYWDHDYWGSDGMTAIAPSVADFMAMLEPLQDPGTGC